MPRGRSPDSRCVRAVLLPERLRELRLRRQRRLDTGAALSCTDGRRLPALPGTVKVGKRRGADATASRPATDQNAIGRVSARPIEQPRTACAYFFSASMYAIIVLMSSSLTCGLGGMGTGPQTPDPPFFTFSASLAAAPASPLYLAATSW